MASINQEIRDIIEKDLAVQKDLSRNLINTRALAKFLIKKYALKASLEAAISAIRRYASDKKVQQEEEKVTSVFKGCSIATRNNIASLTLKLNALKKLHEIIEKTEMIRAVVGSKEIRLIIDEMEIEAIRNIAGKSIIKTDRGLSELSIFMKEKGIKQRGVLARMANEISLRDISINNVLICPPEFIVLVKQKDLVKTHEALMQLTE